MKLWGRWALVPRPSGPAKAAVPASPSTDTMASEWDLVYGQGFYLAHVLQNQLNLLAARFQAQNAAAAQPPVASPNFQLTELSISFSGLNGTLTQGNPGNGATTEFSAFNLQIQEVRVTLRNPTGETAQLQVPNASTAAATSPATSKSASV